MKNREFLFKMINGGNTIEVVFVFQEVYNKYEYDGKTYYSNPKINVKSSSMPDKIAQKEWGMNMLHKKAAHYLGYNSTTKPPLSSCLFNDGKGVTPFFD